MRVRFPQAPPISFFNQPKDTYEQIPNGRINGANLFSTSI